MSPPWPRCWTACGPRAGGSARTCPSSPSARTTWPQQATPALTSIAIPADEVGARAVALLMAKLAGEQVPRATLLPPRLTVRASTARASTARPTNAGTSTARASTRGPDR